MRAVANQSLVLRLKLFVFWIQILHLAISFYRNEGSVRSHLRSRASIRTFAKRLGERRHVNNAKTDVGNSSVGQIREIRGSGRRCRWNYG